MTDLAWQTYEPGVLLPVDSNTYVLRLASTVSDLVPSAEKVFSDRLLSIDGHYNKRGHCVGYSLSFDDKPSVLATDFYVVLDYVAKGKKPKQITFPKLGKKDPSVCLVKFGSYLDNRMYAFIYRRKKD